MVRFRFVCCLGFSLLAACSDPPSQNHYDSRDVGMNATVFYGTIASERRVQVTDQNTGTGAVVGGAGGGVAGSLIGAGNGSVIGALAGVVGGALIGNAVESSNDKRMGIEYVITFDNGVNQSIVQNIARDDVPLHVGQRVMVQMEGTYRRVLPAASATAPMPVPVPAPAGR